MKIFRSLAAVLFVSAFGLAAVAQESSEVAGLRAKAVKGNGIAQYNLSVADFATNGYRDNSAVERKSFNKFLALHLSKWIKT